MGGLEAHKITPVSHVYSDVMATKPTQTTFVTFDVWLVDRQELKDVSRVTGRGFPATPNICFQRSGHTPPAPQSGSEGASSLGSPPGSPKQ